MVRFLRFALIPVVLFCLTILAAAFDSISTNLQQKATWLPVMATVVDAQEFGELGATLSGRAADFPDPYGEISYTVGGETYQWQGRARDIGFVSLPVGGTVSIFYDPADPNQINSLVLLGASVGLMICGSAAAFMAFYVWFFWLRGRGGRPPDTPSILADPPTPRAEPTRPPTQVASPRAARPVRTFGKRA